jgi:hypothetical protein
MDGAMRCTNDRAGLREGRGVVRRIDGNPSGRPRLPSRARAAR